MIASYSWQQREKERKKEKERAWKTREGGREGGENYETPSDLRKIRPGRLRWKECFFPSFFYPLEINQSDRPSVRPYVSRQAGQPSSVRLKKYKTDTYEGRHAFSSVPISAVDRSPIVDRCDGKKPTGRPAIGNRDKETSVEIAMRHPTDPIRSDLSIWPGCPYWSCPKSVPSLPTSEFSSFEPCFSLPSPGCAVASSPSPSVRPILLPREHYVAVMAEEGRQTGREVTRSGPDMSRIFRK